jgi:DNA replication regulator DPB11
MQPSWILECHSTWLKGDDVDLDAVRTLPSSRSPETHTRPQMTAEHRLPIFAGVTVCVSGLDDVAQRTRMSKLVAAQGGAYAKALERPVRVTHLLCAGAGETDKMRYASKFNAAGEARIAVVWAEWFWDCVEYGGAPPARLSPL